MQSKIPTSSFAATAAALFLSACGGSSAPVAAAPSADVSSATVAETVKCQGIHECKGQSACGVEGGHACAGQNDCKGKGWIKVSKEDCDAKGGAVL